MPSPIPTPSPLRRTFIALALFIPTGCLLGIWGIWPWMVDLHARLEPWKIVGHWIGDVAALLCFVWFAISAMIFGVRPVPAHVAKRLRWTTAICMAIGLMIDVGVNWQISRADEAGYANGVVTTGQVLAVRKADAPYILDCVYRDAIGTEHRANLRVFEDRKKPPAVGLGVGTPIELRSKPLPFVIQVRYDPVWPQRCWVEGAGTKHSNDLVTMSHILAIVQGLLLLTLFAAASAAQSASSLVFPWHRLFNAVPLAVEAFLLSFFGMLAGLGRLGLGP